MKQSNHKSYREDIYEFAAEQYGTEPEYLWMKFPDYAVLRHAENRKWYAIIMDVQRKKLGLSGDGFVDIMDIKCDPATAWSLLSEKGILPAYHMNKRNWITVLLDGTVEKDLLFSLLEMSFDITKNRTSSQKPSRTETKEWIIPANPKYFDLKKAFSESDIILWKQSSNVIVGDILYLYVAAPISAILYQCQAVEVEIPYQYDDQNLHISRAMKIKLLHTFDEEQLDFKKLNDYGIHAVRGPRGIPNSLHYEISALCAEMKTE